MWNFLFWGIVVVAISMSFLGLTKEDVQEVVQRQIKEIDSQNKVIAKNAIAINEKADILILENEKLKKKVAAYQMMSNNLNTELIQCQDRSKEDYSGTGY